MWEDQLIQDGATIRGLAYIRKVRAEAEGGTSEQRSSKVSDPGSALASPHDVLETC